MKLRYGLEAIGLLVLFGTPGLAVCPQPHPRVCAEFFKSSPVFVGTVVSKRTVPYEGDFLDGWIYRLRVHRLFRGPTGNFVEVFTENSSARFPLDVGQRYLLFAERYGGRFVIDSCGNSGLLSQAGETIRQIEELEKATAGGEIAGRILAGYGEGYLERPIEGVRVTARGEQKTYATVTDREGRFRIVVPPGKYTVQTESSHWTVSPFDLSYDDPSKIVIHNGGCADLLFLADPR